MWHIEQDGQPKGPYTDEQMKALIEAKVVRKGTLAWKQGMANWLPLSETTFALKDMAADGAAPPALATTDGGAACGTGQLVQPERLSMWRLFIRAISSRYAAFQGRAKRKEYWSFVLFYWLAMLVAGVAGAGIDYAIGNFSGDSGNRAIVAVIAFVLVLFGLLLPHLAVLVRRLHDVGLSGWLVLLNLIPYIGGIVVLVLTLLPSEANENKHGPGTIAERTGA